MSNTSTVIKATLAGGLAGLTLLVSFSVHAQRTIIPFPTIRPAPIDVIRPYIPPNLLWGERSSFVVEGPSTTELTIDGLGIDGRVDVLNDDRPFVIAENFSNRSVQPVFSDYLYSIRIVRMIFQASGGTVGWVAGPPATHTVYYEELDGPTLTAGESFRAEFGPIDPLVDFSNQNGFECGMYEVELVVDSDDDVFEGMLNEDDNSTRHYLFVESDQTFSIQRNTLVAGPVFAPIITPLPFASFDITVPAWSTAETLYLVGFAHTMRSQKDAKITVAPTPSIEFNLGAPPSFAPNAMVMSVVDPTRNARREFGIQPVETGKITVVSEDGCVIRQRSASISVL